MQEAPLKVGCRCCGVARNFDWLFGMITRERLNAKDGRGLKYLDAPSIKDFERRVLPAVADALVTTTTRKELREALKDIGWFCCNCETSQCFARARAAKAGAADKESAALGLQEAPPANTVMPLDVPLRIPAADIPSLPLAAGYEELQSADDSSPAVPMSTVVLRSCIRR